MKPRNKEKLKEEKNEMANLNDLDAIKKIDPQNTVESTNLLIKQCEAAWSQVSQLNIPQEFSSVRNIIFCGMGASIYGALVVRSLLGTKFPYPTEIICDYHLPDYVNENTLVVLTSYSGNTEEPLSCANEAKEKGAQTIVLTKGGELAEFAKQNNIPCYIFDGLLNPAGIPRLGCGYTILGLIGLLSKTNIISINKSDIDDAIKYGAEVFEKTKTKAVEDSKIFQNKIPIIISAEHLSGNAQIFRNQFNETSKTFSAYYLVPDLNHHLMEGLQFPKNSNLVFLTLNSKNYSPKISKRMFLTKEVIQKNNHEVYEFGTNGKNVYEDFIEVLIYASFLTLYLGLLYDQNPAINPWVDYFKDQLKK